MKKIKDLIKEVILDQNEKDKLEQVSLKLTEEIINNYLITLYKYFLNRKPDIEALEFYSDRILNSEKNGFEETLIQILKSDEFEKALFEFRSFKRIFKTKKLIKENCWQWLKSHDEDYLKVSKLNSIEFSKKILRTDVINKILSYKGNNTQYLEIGVRNLEDNFNLINSKTKYCVDPGFEVESNNADFKLDSDKFFEKLFKGEILSSDYKFDVIFIDGLHLASQVDRDIENALNFIKEDGFIILHECNPPSEWHARESYSFYKTPADGAWNGTVWKAFLKRRFDDSLKSCCIDTDWGIGILSKSMNIGSSIKIDNPFFEYKEFNKKRKHYLNLISYEEFESILKTNLKK